MRAPGVYLYGWLITGGLLALTGCAEPTGRFASQRLSGVDRRRTFSAAVRALRTAGFRIAEADEDAARIRTHPLESLWRGPAERLTEAAVKRPVRVRRIATVLISQDGPVVTASCRVQLQRLDTADHRLFMRHREFSDVPSETPIYREAGLTAEQTAAWTDLRRDRAMERQILRAIRERLKPRQTTATAPGR